MKDNKSIFDEKVLSVIIPAYNVKEYIKDCLDSVVSQTYTNMEIIIIDDGSTDGTTDICQKYMELDNRIIFFRRKNSGVVSARLKGVEISKGEYVTFVDADDYIEPIMFEELMKKINNYDLICCGLVYWKRRLEIFSDMEGCYQSEKEMQAIWSKMLYDLKLYKVNPLLPGMYAKIFKREPALQILSSMNKDIVYGEDAVFVYKYILRCKSAFFLNKAFYHYRYREGSTVHSKNDRMLENINKIYKELKPIFDKHYMCEVLNKQLEKWIMRMTMDAINKYMGFSYENRIIRFVVNVEEYVHKDIVVYGAGEMGKDIVVLLEKNGIKKVAWIDREYRKYQKQGLDVENVDVLRNMDFDIILVSVSEEEMARSIKNNLIDMGILEEKIVWKKPVVLV